ncbi:reverse transcriptase domain-containing protein [Tanacetum coccineum]
MADQRTMAELLRAPTEGYVEAIVVPPILAEHFELKHSLINMMTSDQFFGLEKDNPHDHIRWFNKITSTIKYKDVPNHAIKLMLFPFSLAGAARRTTNLRNEISNFQQKFDESFHEAWNRYKYLLRACPHHGFTELHHLDTFYNAFNPADQDSLNSATGGNLLERSTQDVLTIIENKSKVRNSRNKSVFSQVKSSDGNSSSSDIAKLTHAVNQQTSVVTTAMTAILKQFQATPPPASVKAVEEICVTCGGPHPYYQCLAADGNTFLEYRDNIQGYVAAATGNYNQGNSGYRPPGVVNQTRPPGFVQQNGQNNQNRFSQPQGYNRGNNFNQNPTYQAPIQQNQSVPLSELEKIKKMNDVNIKAMQAQINNVKNELRNEMQSSIQASMSNQTNELKNMMASFFQMNTASTSAVILKKLPKKLGDHGKFLIPCSFSELKCKALADLGASINLMPLSVWKKLRLPELISTQMTLELANRDICTPIRIARDVFVSIGKFTFLADFVIVDYESDPRVPLILGRPFLRTDRALIDVHGEEMILRDGNERLILNMRNDTSSYSNEPHQESINMIDVHNVSHEEILKDLFATNHPSGNPTPISEPETKSSSSSPTLTSIEESDLVWEEFEVYLARNDDLPFDAESDLRELEYLLNHVPTKAMDSILEDSVDENSLDDNLDETISEMFTDEHALDYSSPPLWDDYDDNLFDLETVNDDTYDDPFDSKEEKIKDSKILIDELIYFLFDSFHVDYPDSGDSTINVVEDIPVDVPNILPTHPALLMDFDFIPSHNDLGSDPDVSSHSGDRNKSYYPGICIEVESTRFLAPQSRMSRIFEASRARGFVLRSLELHILSFILGIRYPNLID